MDKCSSSIICLVLDDGDGSIRSLGVPVKEDNLFIDDIRPFVSVIYTFIATN